MNHVIQWQTASPLWEEALEDRINNKRFKQPALLRFAGDNFMENLEKTLSTDPSPIKDFVAHYETRKNEGSGWLSEDMLSGHKSLKLYQPVHGRFYLVAASLVCRLPGLPDKTLDIANEEKVSFLMRRLVPRSNKVTLVPEDPDTYFEYGWFVNQNCSGWCKIDNPLKVAPDEERLPMFSMNFKMNSQNRHLLAGFVPVGNSETYQAAPGLSPIKPSEGEQWDDTLADPRSARFEATIIEPVNQLLETLQNVLPNAISQEKAQEVLLFILLDLAEFLKEHLRDVWEAIKDGHWTELTDSRKKLYNKLYTTILYPGKRLDEALQNVLEINMADKIISGDIKDPDSGKILITGNLTKNAIENLITNLITHDTECINTDSFNYIVKDALGIYSQADKAEEAVKTPKILPGSGIFYIIRCLYERPRCKGLYTPVLSEEPTQPFQIASFFDPDAPGRPIHITMPIDTSIAGLRKFPKNVSFLLSNKLRQQMEQIKGIKLEDLDQGNIGEEKGFDLGRICSFSIPIISLCAMILLMIIVQLLNIVFWWLPFFKICFPLNLKSE
ncbi:MAG: hypothetical protein ACMUIU_01495 [bacterium]